MKRKNFTRTLTSVGGILLVVVLGILSLFIYMREDVNVRIYGQRLTMTPEEPIKFLTRPVFDVDGDFDKIGIQLIGIRDDSVLRNLGLEFRDIIKVFNGKRILNLADFIIALYDLYLNPDDRDHVVTEIIRNGKSLTVTFYAVR